MSDTVCDASEFVSITHCLTLRLHRYVRILIVKLSSIGDVIHALPSVAFLRRSLPDAEISWVVERAASEMIRDSPVIDRLIEIDTRSMRGGKVIEEIVLDMGRQAKLVREHKYDLAIDMQGLLKSAVIAKISGAGVRWGFSKKDLRESFAGVFYTNQIASVGQVNIIEKNVRLAAAAVGIEPDLDPIEFPIATDQTHVDEADAIARGRRFVLLNPGGGWVTKLWPAENFGLLARRIRSELGLEPIITVGPNEAVLGERAKAAAAFDIEVVTPSLKAFYELARRADFYVGGDTGPTHIAVAVGTPIVGIYGPTEWWRNGSPRHDDICVERNDIGCRVDCHRRKCDNWICMEITVDRVFDAVAERLSRAGR